MFAEIVQLIKYQIQQEELASATQALDMFPQQIQNSSLQKHVFNAQLDRLQTERVLNVPPAVQLWPKVKEFAPVMPQNSKLKKKMSRLLLPLESHKQKRCIAFLAKHALRQSFQEVAGNAKSALNYSKSTPRWELITNVSAKQVSEQPDTSVSLNRIIKLYKTPYQVVS